MDDFGIVLRDPFARYREGERSLELLRECITHALNTGEPLPEDVLHDLLVDIDLLISRREGRLLRREQKKPTTHPEAVNLERLAVIYIQACRAFKLDSAPVKTICETAGVSRKAVMDWQHKYPRFLGDRVPRDSLAFHIVKPHLQTILDQLKNDYQRFKQQ